MNADKPIPSFHNSLTKTKNISTLSELHLLSQSLQRHCRSASITRHESCPPLEQWYQWNHIACAFLCLSSFAQRDIREIHVAFLCVSDLLRTTS